MHSTPDEGATSDPGAPSHRDGRSTRLTRLVIRTAARGVATAVAGVSLPSFVLVMATGIVSVASSLSGMNRIALSLFRLNEAIYATLGVITLVRLMSVPGRVLAELTDHTSGPGCFA